MNTIITVNVDKMTAQACASKSATILKSVEKSAFNVALLGAYATGVEIPSYKLIEKSKDDNGAVVESEVVVAGGTIEKKVTPKDFYTLVGRSKSTLSRWIKAINYVIEDGNFGLFATGTLPFSYDKIIAIHDKNLVEVCGKSINELFELSAKALEGMESEKAQAQAEDEDAEDFEDEEGAEDEGAEVAEPVESAEPTTFVYNGTTYEVDSALLAKFIAENCKAVELA